MDPYKQVRAKGRRGQVSGQAYGLSITSCHSYNISTTNTYIYVISLLRLKSFRLMHPPALVPPRPSVPLEMRHISDYLPVAQQNQAIKQYQDTPFALRSSKGH